MSCESKQSNKEMRSWASDYVETMYIAKQKKRWWWPMAAKERSTGIIQAQRNGILTTQAISWKA